jgi:hypothetical protein
MGWIKKSNYYEVTHAFFVLLTGGAFHQSVGGSLHLLSDKSPACNIYTDKLCKWKFISKNIPSAKYEHNWPNSLLIKQHGVLTHCETK